MERLKKVIDKARGDDTPCDGDDHRLPSITDNAAFNANALPDGKEDVMTKAQKVKYKVKSAAHMTAHPVRTVKERSTKQIVGNERPWLDDQKTADQELFEAHDALEDFQNERLKEDKFEEEEHDALLQSKQKRVRDVEESREEQHAAWHMARNVHRVRAVRRPLAYPPRERYKKFDANGEYAGLHWVKWIGHLVLYGFQDCSLHYVNPTNVIPYDREVLTRRIERLIVASESFQLWWMRVRRVYTWEDPWLTFKWLMVFLVLLKTGYIMSFYWGYLLYSCVTNFYGTHSRHWMRDSHHRAHETTNRAAMLSELIVRHGHDAWLEPFLDEFGPWVQLQIGDIADFLEVSANYYDWHNVNAGIATCVAYCALFLISAVPSLQWSMKVYWMSCGLFFFISRPIAANYPRFRHVVDPVRWMYWNHPTMSESAFAYLRNKAWSSLVAQPEESPYSNANDGGVFEEDIDHDVFFDCLSVSPMSPMSPMQRLVADGSISNDTPYKAVMTLPATWSGRRGHLEISRVSVRFVSTARSLRDPSTTFSSKGSRQRQSTYWERFYPDVLELRKMDQAGGKMQADKGSAALSILWAPADEPALLTTEEQSNDQNSIEEELLYGMNEDRRNEAFNAILGISGQLWTELQVEPGWQKGLH